MKGLVQGTRSWAAYQSDKVGAVAVYLMHHSISDHSISEGGLGLMPISLSTEARSSIGGGELFQYRR